MRSLFCAALVFFGAASLGASEEDAIWISRGILDRHMPSGTLVNPVYEAPGSDQILTYTRCGDSAIWTGHYLAAESFRYRVTRSAEALDAVRKALDGIRMLVEVTGGSHVARCAVPVDSPYVSDLVQEESQHGAYPGVWNDQAYYWIGNTSRDQYSGVFFGLSVAYDMVDNVEVRAMARTLVTRLLANLLDSGWAVVMPNGAVSTVFWGRADQQLALLQIGRHVNRESFDFDYKSLRFWNAGSVTTPVSTEVLEDHESYFKFNLDTINLYSLIRLEDSSWYKRFYVWAYVVLRRTTDGHGNAHFNMIDRALNGPNQDRDRETRALLEAWLERPRRDEYIDLRGSVAACGNDRVCAPIPVPQRVRTDFLWQRSPFLLYGGGNGTIEAAGIDYILPYWMARYYGVIPAPQR